MKFNPTSGLNRVDVLLRCTSTFQPGVVMRKMKNQKIADQWTLYEGAWHNGLPILLRIREDLNGFIGHPDYHTGFRITWAFQNPKEDGYPSTSDKTQLERFENLFFNAVEEEQQAIVAAVITHNGERDWTIYTSNSKITHERLLYSLKGEPRYPIEIITAPDPDWNEYLAIQVNIKDKLER